VSVPLILLYISFTKDPANVIKKYNDKGIAIDKNTSIFIPCMASTP
jgi:hypothetical protein